MKTPARRRICTASIAAFAVAGMASAEAQTTWTRNGANDLWNNPANWSAGLPDATSNVFFPLLPPTGAGAISLNGGSLANALSFSNSYALTGGNLALTSGAVFVDVGATGSIGSVLTGAGGLTKTGLGALVLSNNANDYTGLTTISQGAVIITASNALGSDPSTVTVTGAASSTSFGGQLVVADGLTFDRNLSLSGRGPWGISGAALVTAGNTTLTGAITTSSVNETRIAAGYGNTTLAGPLTLGAGQTTQFIGSGNVTLGGFGGGSNASILEKNGVGTLGTLILLGNSNSFAGEVRASSGSIRATAGTGIATFGVNGGTLELRTSDGSAFSSSKLVLRNSGTIFADHAAGGSGQNGTIVFGDTSSTVNNQAYTFSGRNGYGITLTGAGGATGNINLATGNGTTFTNNLSGQLLFNGSLNLPNDATARTITIGGSGDTRITGSILAAGGAHVLSKTGAGTLTIVGADSTYTGGTSITGGTISISNFGSLNGATGSLTLNGGALNYTGTGETTAKALNLAGTTGSATLLANQVGATQPLVFSAAAFAAAPGAGAKSFVLGGANTLDNEIQTVITENSSSNSTTVTKIGGGTWALSGDSGASASGFSKMVINDGVLKLKASSAAANVVKDTATLDFSINSTTQGGAGTLEYVANAAGSSETIGAVTTTSGAATIKLTRPSGATGPAALMLTSFAPGSSANTANFVVDGGENGTDAKIVINGVSASGLISPRVYFNGANFASYHGSGATGYVEALSYLPTEINTLTGGGNSVVNASNAFAAPATAVKSLKLSDSATLTLSSGTLILNTGTNTAGGILADSGVSEITGGNISTGGSGELVVRVNGASDQLTLTSLLTSGSSGGFSKSGAGTLIINNSGNALSGNLRILEGTVKLASGAKLGTTGSVLAVRAGTFDFGGNSPTYLQLLGSGTLTNSSATADSVLTFGDASAQTFSGAIRDGDTKSMGIVKAGAGAQTMSGVSSYTGVTRINAGSIVASTLANIGADSAIGKGADADNATNAASLVFGGGALQYTGGASITINRLFTLAGAGTLDASGANNASIVFGNTAAVAYSGSGTRTLTLQGGSTGDNEIRLKLIDNPNAGEALSVTKSGSGLWVLGNSGNSYTGATTVGQGALRVGDDGSAATRTLPLNSPLVLGATTNNGVLETSGTFTRALAATATAGTGSVTWGGSTGGGGFAASGDKLLVNLGGSGAPLTWGAGGFVPTGAPLVFGSSAAIGEVTFANGIDLGAASRTIQVDDNSTTSTDMAVISGALTGTGGVTKTGSGFLLLSGANSYTGDTLLNSGHFAVKSFGGTGAATSSVGGPGGAVKIGNGGTQANLYYIGNGERSDRAVQLTTSTANAVIYADGAGALVLSNVSNAAAGAKTFFLRGQSTDANEISSSLADNGGALAITKDQPGTWILSGNNSGMSGTVSISAGAIGVGSNTALGTGTVSMNTGTMFASGDNRTIGNAVSISNNTTNIVLGNYPLTWTGNVTVGAGANSNTFTNNLAAGKTWTISGQFSHGDTNGKTQIFNGSGDTTLAGVVTQTGTGNLGIQYSGTGSLTLSNPGNSYNGATTLSNGTLRLGANEVIPNASTSGNVTINPGSGLTATFDLNGKTETINGLTATSAGTTIIDNTAAGAASLTFGANNAAVTFGAATGGFQIRNSGGGPLSLVKTGSGAATITSAAALSYTGATSVNGGAFNIAAALNGTNALSATGNGTLNLTGAMNTPGAVGSVTVGGGAALNVVNGAGSAFTNLSALSLGAGAGSAALALELGSLSNYDRFGVVPGGTAVVANTVQFTLTSLAGFGAGTYTLLSADSGLNSATYTLSISSPLAQGFGYSLASSAGSVALNVAAADSTMYWTGAADAKWNTRNASFQGSNWSSTANGSVIANATPGANTDVVFSATNAAGANTTLETNFTINSLTFNGAPGGVSPVIASGTGTNTLTIAPSASTSGISIASGGPSSATISARLGLGADQTWNVSDAGSTLTISGIASGTDDNTSTPFVTKTGAGLAELTAANTFTGNVQVNAGALRLGNAAALGAAGNTATVAGGSLVYSTAVPNAVVLSGGALATLANLTLTGQVTLTASTNSNFNAADFTTPTTARTTQHKGLWTGGGNLLLDGSGISTGRGILSLQRTTNDLSGTITLGNNVSLENRPTTSTGADSIAAGKTLGSASIVFQGANSLLDLRDTFGSNTTVGKTSNYGNNVAFNNSGTIALDSNNSGQTNFFNQFLLGSLTTGAGAAPTITVTSTNSAAPTAVNADGTQDRSSGYLLSFTDATFNDHTTINTANPFRIAGATNAVAKSITKAGAGTLTFDGRVQAGDLTVNAGTVRLNNLTTAAPNVFTGTVSATGGALSVTAPIGGGTNGLGASGVSLGNGGALRLTPAALPLSTNAALTPGLLGSYYALSTGFTNGGDHGARVDLTIAPTATRIDSQVNSVINASGFTGLMDGSTTGTDRPTGINATNMTALWRGFVKVDVAGNYLFNTTSDDGSMVFVDGVQVVFSDQNQGGTVTRNGGIYLEPGYHFINARYSQGTGGGGVVLRWQSTDAGINTATPIPASALFNTNDATALSVGNNVAIAAGATSTIDASGADTTLTGTLTLGNGGVAQLISSTANALALNGPISIDTAGVFRTSKPSAVSGAEAYATDVVVNGAISEASPGSSFSKLGLGNLTLSGNNSFTGSTSIGSGGSLTVAHNNALGTGVGAAATVTVASGGQLILDGGRAIGDKPLTLSGVGIAYGSNNNSTAASLGGGALRSTSGANSWAGAVTMAANSTIQVDAGSLTLSGGIVESGGARALTKTGAGSLILGGTSIYTGNTNLNAGTLVFDTGASVTAPKLLVGYGAGLSASVIQKAGTTVSIGAATGSTDVLSLGATGGYGYYWNQGGSLTTGQLAPGGNSAGANTTGVFEQTGGSTTISAANGYLVLGWQGTNANSVVNLYNGSLVNNSTTNDTVMAFGTNTGSFSMINLLGAGALMNTTAGGTARTVNLALAPGNFAGVLNLNGGVLIANAVRAGSAGTPSFLNFDGGTLRANTATATLVNNLTAATIYGGGATIDTNGQNVTIPQALLAPTGGGVASIPVVDGGSGYLGAPAVRITGGGGAGATAIAEVDLDPASPTYGKVTHIRITSAGSGYTSAPTVTLYGGGAATPASLDAAVTAANTSTGGLTKTGNGTLTLSAANTYAGATQINGGTLAFSASANLGDASATNSLGFNGGVLSYTGAGALNLGAGRGVALGAGGGTVDTPAGALTLSGNVTASGASSFTKTGAGALTLSGANLSGLNGGALTVSAGTLNLAGSPGAALSPSALTVASGATLDLGNGAGQTINLGGGLLTLGAAAGTTTLNFELGSTAAYDRILTTNSAVVNGAIQLNITALAGFGTGIYDLVKAAGGLTSTGGVWTLNAPGGYAYSKNISDSLIQLGVTTVTGDAYWRGDVDGSWSTVVLGSSNDTNWATTASGTTDRLAGPGANTTVYFSAGNVDLSATSGVLNTTLDNAVAVHDLKFTSSPASVTAVNIAAGTGGSLTIAPSVSSVGIDVASNAGAVTISAPLTVGAAQTWSVSGTGASLALTGGLNGAASATKIGAGALSLAGTGNHSGTLNVNEGAVQISGAFSSNSTIAVAPGAVLRLNGNTASIASLAGTGVVENGHATTAGTLAIGAGNASSSFGGVLRNGAAAALNLTKIGNGTLTLTSLDAASANNYTGATTIDQGVLAITTDASLSGALVFGSTNNTTTTGTLNLAAASASFGGLTVQTNTTSANVLNIGAGETLTLTGDVVIGSALDTGSVLTNTVLNTTGGGSLTVNNPAANGVFSVGGYKGTTAPRGNRAIADFRGLDSLTITLNSTNGALRVSNTGTANTAGSYATMYFAPTTTVTANLLEVGSGGSNNNGANQINQLFLGSASNTLNVNTINLGAGTRDVGQLVFNGPTGTIKIRNAAGTGRATLGIGSAGGGTGVLTQGDDAFDVRGHQADLLLAAVNVGSQNRGAPYTSLFGFDQGVLDMTSLTMAVRSANASTGSGPYTTTSTVNLGGGTVTIGNGILQAGQITGGTNAHTVTSVINLSGGDISIGATSGNSIVMANVSSSTAPSGSNTMTANSTVNVSGGTVVLSGGIQMARANIAASTATAALNVTGGSIKLGGDITRVGGAGASSASVTLDGGTLDMSGKNIGGANAVAFNALSGTLKNVGLINNGGDFTKTGSGALTVEGANGWTGATNVLGGELIVSGSISGTSSVSVDAGGTLTVNGALNPLAAIASSGVLRGGGSVGAVNAASGLVSPGSNGAGVLSTGDFTLGGAAKLTIEIGGTTAGAGYDQLNVSGGISLAGELQGSLINGFYPTENDLFFIAINDGNDAVATAFSNAAGGTVNIGGVAWNIYYNADSTANGGRGAISGGNDIALAIPEPGSAGMLLGASSLLLGLQRFRRRVKA